MPAPPQEDPFASKVIDDRYRLLRRIGSGGISLVYLAERIGMGKPVAIKFLRSAFANLPGFVRRFEREAQACSRLSHVNCVSVMDYGVAFGIPYLVMEHVGGITLAELIARGPLAPRRAIQLVRQILAGLRHAHARSVVHRDLKPANVMLVEMTGTQDFAKIMDFGTAEILTGEATEQRASGTEIGTPWYMAPEQAAGQPTDNRTDLYAVAVILFELLTGERPYIADDPLRVLQMHLTQPIPSPRALRPQIGISPELEQVIVRGMQKQPEQRFSDAEAFDSALQRVPENLDRTPGAPFTREEIESSLRTGPEPALDPELDLEPADPPAPESRAPRPRRTVAIALTVLALLLAAGLGVLFYLMQTGRVTF